MHVGRCLGQPTLRGQWTEWPRSSVRGKGGGWVHRLRNLTPWTEWSFPFSRMR
jgi:hypothetical protein